MLILRLLRNAVSTAKIVVSNEILSQSSQIVGRPPGGGEGGARIVSVRYIYFQRYVGYIFWQALFLAEI
jgi:hypothetical protein